MINLETSDWALAKQREEPKKNSSYPWTGAVSNMARLEVTPLPCLRFGLGLGVSHWMMSVARAFPSLRESQGCRPLACSPSVLHEPLALLLVEGSLEK